MARKPYLEEPDQPDRWLVSYADFITLLFALFVVMYAMASMPGMQFRQLSSSLGEALGSKVSVPTAGAAIDAVPILHMDSPELPQMPILTPIVIPPIATDVSVIPISPDLPMSADEIRHQTELRREKTQMKNIADQLEQRLGVLIEQGKVHVTQANWGINVEINASILFAPAAAVLDLNSTSEQILHSIVDVLKNQSYLIHVEGHTDDQPINTPLYPSNWELSSARAGSVVRLFIDMGIYSARLVAIGHAANKPVASNSTPDGRQRNRRVQIMILADTIERFEKVDAVNAMEKAEVLLP